jgi:hypothetical protein
VAAIQGQAQLLHWRNTRRFARRGGLLKGLAQIENSTRVVAHLLDE